jgi:hypothetical protein
MARDSKHKRSHHRGRSRSSSSSRSRSPSRSHSRSSARSRSQSRRRSRSSERSESALCSQSNGNCSFAHWVVAVEVRRDRSSRQLTTPASSIAFGASTPTMYGLGSGPFPSYQGFAPAIPQSGRRLLLICHFSGAVIAVSYYRRCASNDGYDACNDGWYFPL